MSSIWIYIQCCGHAYWPLIRTEARVFFTTIRMRAILNFTCLGWRFKFVSAASRASALCWAEASSRRWFSWNLTVKGGSAPFAPRSIHYHWAILPRCHHLIHPRIIFSSMSVSYYNCLLSSKFVNFDHINPDAGCQRNQYK
jgi:hypothetical protein